MNALIWLLRTFLFFTLLGLALKNSSEVQLRFFFDANWLVPLSLVVLTAMSVGAVLGLLALLPQWVRQRRTISKLQRQLLRQGEVRGERAAAKQPVLVDG